MPVWLRWRCVRPIIQKRKHLPEVQQGLLMALFRCWRAEIKNECASIPYAAVSPSFIGNRVGVNEALLPANILRPLIIGANKYGGVCVPLIECPLIDFLISRLCNFAVPV